MASLLQTTEFSGNEPSEQERNIMKTEAVVRTSKPSTSLKVRTNVRAGKLLTVEMGGCH